MTAKQEPENLLMNRSAGGFTTIQLLITVAIISVVSVFALVGIQRVSASMRLSGSTRQLAGYLEKARSDAVRRHVDKVTTHSKVVIDSTTGYSVTMDFALDGSQQTRSFTLSNGVQFDIGVPIGLTVEFDWRGRVPNEFGIQLINEYQEPARINISGSGDVTLNSEIFLDTNIAGVTLNSNVSPVVASGSSSSGGGSSSSPTPTPSPTAQPTGAVNMYPRPGSVTMIR